MWSTRIPDFERPRSAPRSRFRGKTKLPTLIALSLISGAILAVWHKPSPAASSQQGKNNQGTREKQINLLYTVNNLSYVGLCG